MGGPAVGCVVGGGHALVAPRAPCVAFRVQPAKPISLEVSGPGCGLHVCPTRRGAHSSSGLQARSRTLGKPSLSLPVPTASGPHRTPSLPAPALGGLDACRPVSPAASLTGVSTAVLRGWAACCGVGGGHLRGEGELRAPRPPPLWHLALCSSRRPMVRGCCGCVRTRPLWEPKSSPQAWAYLASRVLTGLLEGWGAWELGSLRRPQRAAVEGGRSHPQPRAGPCFVPCGGHILVGNGCLGCGGWATSLALPGPACSVWTCVRGQQGSCWASRALGPPTRSGRVLAARHLWGCPSTSCPVSRPLRWSPGPM